MIFKENKLNITPYFFKPIVEIAIDGLDTGTVSTSVSKQALLAMTQINYSNDVPRAKQDVAEVIEEMFYSNVKHFKTIYPRFFEEGVTEDYTPKSTKAFTLAKAMLSGSTSSKELLDILIDIYIYMKYKVINKKSSTGIEPPVYNDNVFRRSVYIELVKICDNMSSNYILYHYNKASFLTEKLEEELSKTLFKGEGAIKLSKGASKEEILSYALDRMIEIQLESPYTPESYHENSFVSLLVNACKLPKQFRKIRIECMNLANQRSISSFTNSDSEEIDKSVFEKKIEVMDEQDEYIENIEKEIDIPNLQEHLRAIYDFNRAHFYNQNTNSIEFDLITLLQEEKRREREEELRDIIDSAKIVSNRKDSLVDSYTRKCHTVLEFYKTLGGEITTTKHYPINSNKCSSIIPLIEELLLLPEITTGNTVEIFRKHMKYRRFKTSEESGEKNKSIFFRLLTQDRYKETLERFLLLVRAMMHYRELENSLRKEGKSILSIDGMVTRDTSLLNIITNYSIMEDIDTIYQIESEAVMVMEKEHGVEKYKKLKNGFEAMFKMATSIDMSDVVKSKQYVDLKNSDYRLFSTEVFHKTFYPFYDYQNKFNLKVARPFYIKEENRLLRLGLTIADNLTENLDELFKAKSVLVSIDAKVKTNSQYKGYEYYSTGVLDYRINEDKLTLTKDTTEYSKSYVNVRNSLFEINKEKILDNFKEVDINNTQGNFQTGELDISNFLDTELESNIYTRIYNLFSKNKGIKKQYYLSYNRIVDSSGTNVVLVLNDSDNNDKYYIRYTKDLPLMPENYLKSCTEGRGKYDSTSELLPVDLLNAIDVIGFKENPFSYTEYNKCTPYMQDIIMMTYRAYSREYTTSVFKDRSIISKAERLCLLLGDTESHKAIEHIEARSIALKDSEEHMYKLVEYYRRYIGGEPVEIKSLLQLSVNDMKDIARIITRNKEVKEYRKVNNIKTDGIHCSTRNSFLRIATQEFSLHYNTNNLNTEMKRLGEASNSNPAMLESLQIAIRDREYSKIILPSIINTSDTDELIEYPILYIKDALETVTGRLVDNRVLSAMTHTRFIPLPPNILKTILSSESSVSAFKDRIKFYLMKYSRKNELTPFITIDELTEVYYYMYIKYYNSYNNKVDTQGSLLYKNKPIPEYSKQINKNRKVCMEIKTILGNEDSLNKRIETIRENMYMGSDNTPIISFRDIEGQIYSDLASYLLINNNLKGMSMSTSKMLEAIKNTSQFYEMHVEPKEELLSSFDIEDNYITSTIGYMLSAICSNVYANLSYAMLLRPVEEKEIRDYYSVDGLLTKKIYVPLHTNLGTIPKIGLDLENPIDSSYLIDKMLNLLEIDKNTTFRELYNLYEDSFKILGITYLDRDSVFNLNNISGNILSKYDKYYTDKNIPEKPDLGINYFETDNEFKIRAKRILEKSYLLSVPYCGTVDFTHSSGDLLSNSDEIISDLYKSEFERGNYSGIIEELKYIITSQVKGEYLSEVRKSKSVIYENVTTLPGVIRGIQIVESARPINKVQGTPSNTILRILEEEGRGTDSEGSDIFRTIINYLSMESTDNTSLLRDKSGKLIVVNPIGKGSDYYIHSYGYLVPSKESDNVMPVDFNILDKLVNKYL